MNIWTQYLIGNISADRFSSGLKVEYQSHLSFELKGPVAISFKNTSLMEGVEILKKGFKSQFEKEISKFDIGLPSLFLTFPNKLLVGFCVYKKKRRRKMKTGEIK